MIFGDTVASQIVIDVVQIDRTGWFLRRKFVKKPIGEDITIGIERDDISFGLEMGRLGILDRSHGRVFVESGVFTKHLDYEDTSLYGTWVLHWENNVIRPKYVHNDKEKLKPGDWILMGHKGQVGLIIIPSIK